MKRAISILLAVLVIINSCGLMIFYMEKIRLCEKNAYEFLFTSRNLDLNSLTIFNTDFKDFQIINGNEIVSNGKLFDIVRIEKSNSKTLYFTIHDDEEDGYVKCISQISDSNSNDKDSSTSKKVAEEVKLIFNHSEQKNSTQHFHFIDLQENVYGFLNNYNTSFKRVTSPPPEFIFS